MKTKLIDIKHPFKNLLYLFIFILSGTYSHSGIGAETRFGFTPFPYDFTEKAINKTYSLTNKSNQIFLIHRDNGIPWSEAYYNKPYPKKVTESWNGYKKNIPSNQPVYLALTPLNEDRTDLMRASEGSKKPKIFKGLNLDDDKIKKAYLQYVRKAVKTFKPKYLNIGVEAGELAHRKPRKWLQFERLFNYVYTNIKKENPGIYIGISFGLQTLMDDKVQKKVKNLVEKSDYIGISFYPYMSEFHKRFGAHALPKPPQEWLKPLNWLKTYTDKPIAICETGYSTKNIDLPTYNLHLKGSEHLQYQYLNDLIHIARRDNYLFVSWFLYIDYDKLYAKMPKGDGSNKLWKNIGFFDQHFKPKPAWNLWQKEVLNRSNVIAIAPRAPKSNPKRDTSLNLYADKVNIGFSDGDVKFKGSSYDKLTIIPVNGSNKALQWKYDYKKDRWQWILNTIKEGILKGKKRVSFEVKSNSSGTILFQLEESTGESFFSVVHLSDNWNKLTLNLSDFTPDPSKKKNGKLETRKINKLLFADAGAVTEGQKGQRTIIIKNFYFE